MSSPMTNAISSNGGRFRWSMRNPIGKGEDEKAEKRQRSRHRRRDQRLRRPQWQTPQVIVQVKSGKVPGRDIRDLRGVLDREEAPIAVYITLKTHQGYGLRMSLSRILYLPSLAEGFSAHPDPYHRRAAFREKLDLPPSLWHLSKSPQSEEVRRFANETRFIMN